MPRDNWNVHKKCPSSRRGSNARLLHSPVGSAQNTVALDVVAHNIANANTPGYSRQEVLFAERPPSLSYGHLVGQGVDIADIRSAYNEATEFSINRNTSDSAAIDAQLQTVRDIESLLTPGQGSISDHLESLFNELESLTAHPDDAGARTVVVHTAGLLAQGIHDLSNQLRAMRTSLDEQIVTSLTEIHQLSAQLASVSAEIRDAEWQGRSSANLVSQRNQLLDALSEQIDVRMERQPNADAEVNYTNTVFRLAGGQLAFGSDPVELIANTSGPETTILRTGSAEPLSVSDGRLGGLLTARNEIVPEYLARIDAFAKSLIAALDTAHATGVGTDGAFDRLLGLRGVADVTEPLAAAGLYLPVQQGSLFVTVTDPRGERALHQVAIDPASQSLTDIANAISTIDHIQAITDAQSGRMSLLAEPGYTFDFAGSLPTTVAGNITGTARPTFGGIYTGKENGEYTFEFLGSGTVGVTDSLNLEVRDAQGKVLAMFNVGAAYEPGTDLSIADGVSLRLASGTANAGDSFSTFVVARPDDTGVLAALGLNTLFAGDLATGVRVSSALLDDPQRLATSRTGQALDSRNAQAMERLRGEARMAGQSQTFEVFLAQTVAAIGAESASLAQFQDNLGTIRQSLEAERQAVSGVDPNEEILHMLQYQRAFQSAARYVAAIDATLEELFNIIR